MVPENPRHEEDNEFRRCIPQKDEDPKGFIPFNERISLVYSDIRDDASLLRVVTPPVAGIA
jgi:hypothetical protein